MYKATRYLSIFTFWLAQAAILGTMSIVTFEVGARYLFHSPTQSSLELTEYLLVAMGFLPLAAIYAEKGHVSVDLLTNMLSARWQHICKGLALLISFVFGALVFWYGLKMSIHAFESRTASSSLLAFPMWIAYSVMPLGFLAFALESLTRLLDLVKEKS